MSQKWLNYILHLSSYSYKKKKELLTKPIFKCICIAFEIILIELYLALISIPIFFCIPSKHFKTKYKGLNAGELNLYFSKFMVFFGSALIIVSLYCLTMIVPFIIYFLLVFALFLFLLYAVYSQTWTNISFKFSNYIFSIKQQLLESTVKLKSVILAFYILILEILLLIISLPVYVFISPETLKKLKSDRFKLRRKLTLVFLLFILLILILQTMIAIVIVDYLYIPRAY